MRILSIPWPNSFWYDTAVARRLTPHRVCCVGRQRHSSVGLIFTYKRRTTCEMMWTLCQHLSSAQRRHEIWRSRSLSPTLCYTVVSYSEWTAKWEIRFKRRFRWQRSCIYLPEKNSHWVAKNVLFITIRTRRFQENVTQFKDKTPWYERGLINLISAIRNCGRI